MKTSVKLVAAFILAAILAVVIYNIIVARQFKNNIANLPTSEYGVWAVEGVEVVRTQNLSLSFYNKGDVVYANLIKFRPDTVNKVRAEFICRVVLDSQKVVKSEVLANIDSVIDMKYVGQLVDNVLLFRIDNENVDMKEKFVRRRLHRIEELEITALPEFFSVNANNIGDCLQQWALGSYFTNDDNTVSAQIGTNKHSYIFMVNQDMVYCRAARIRSNNNGTCFAQNIRLMHNANEHTATFADHNYEISSSELVIDDSKFDANKCFFADDAIYWSFKSFSENEIQIHGCGEIYTWKPNTSGNEYFKFIKY